MRKAPEKQKPRRSLHGAPGVMAKQLCQLQLRLLRLLALPRVQRCSVGLHLLGGKHAKVRPCLGNRFFSRVQPLEAQTLTLAGKGHPSALSVAPDGELVALEAVGLAVDD